MFRGRRILIVALFVALNVAGAAAFFAFDLGALMREPQKFVDMIENAGDFKPIAFLTAGTLAHFLFLNGPAVWAAPSLFSLPVAYIYALVITLGGSFLPMHWPGSSGTMRSSNTCPHESGASRTGWSDARSPPC